MLLVNRARLSVVVGLIVVGVENLDFVAFHEKNAAVSAVLSLALRYCRCSPLDVELDIAEPVARRDVAGTKGDFHVSVPDLPFGRTSVTATPM